MMPRCVLLQPTETTASPGTRTVLMSALFAFVLVCAMGCTPTPPETPPSPSTQAEAIAQDQQHSTPPPQPSGAEEDTPSAGTIPDTVPHTVLEAIATDLSQAVKGLIIEEAIAQSWSDGCLGLAQPDEFCSMAIVDGWRVQISDGQTTWIYRSNGDGSVLRREE